MNDQERTARVNFWQNIVSVDKRYNLGTITLVAKDLAYFAGIFDTEIHFNLVRAHNIRIDYTKHNEDLLKLFVTSFGGKIYKSKPRPERKIDIWNWKVSSNQAYKILKNIQPFLRINWEKARLCIECYEKCEASGLSRSDKAKIGERYIELINNCETKPEHRFDYFGLPHLKMAYLAGIFDVDSTITITRRTEKGRNSYTLEVIKRKHDYETMEFIRGIFGGNIHIVTKSRLNKDDVWGIRYFSKNAYRLLEQIYPYLKAQKSIAEICMEFQNRYFTGEGGVEVSPERKAIGAAYLALLHSYHLKWRSRYGKGFIN